MFENRRLTLPSRGRATSGFACCRPPLMSNVRPFEVMPVKHVAFGSCHGSAGPSVCAAGEPPRRAHSSSRRRSSGLSVARAASAPLAVLARARGPSLQPACSLSSSKRKALHQASVSKHNRSRALSSSQSESRTPLCGYAGRSIGRVAMGSRLQPQSVSLVRASTLASSVCSGLRPNTSVNRTSNSGLRPPSAAGYLER